uniref:Uncharacterized protein n=1 Tax=Culex tarsalis TaxID=7177 RepID=A0A1Q3FT17_CULTA
MPSGGNKKSPGATSRGKSSKSGKAPAGNEASNSTAAATAQNGATGGDEDQNSGFAEYLRSSQGAEMLKLFVVANSIVMFLTVAWPQMKKSYELLMTFFGDEGEDEF